MESFIGWWGFREGTTRWHLVESEVTDRLVMRCGRQMRMELDGTPLVFEAAPNGPACIFCTTRQRAT
jgi:hypothetical protein